LAEPFYFAKDDIAGATCNTCGISMAVQLTTICPKPTAFSGRQAAPPAQSNISLSIANTNKFANGFKQFQFEFRLAKTIT